MNRYRLIYRGCRDTYYCFASRTQKREWCPDFDSQLRARPNCTKSAGVVNSID